LLYDWWPAAVAIVPTLTFLAAGAVLTARRERR
jgi:lipopolysaccharide export system permease protein